MPVPDLSRNAILHVLLVVVLGLLVYSNTFRVPFVFDDECYILENPIVKKSGFFLDPLSEDGAHLPDNVRIHLYTRYVGYLTFYLNYLIGGHNAFGYHVFNISAHLINGLLVYALVRAILGMPLFRGQGASAPKELTALFSALVFVLHPVQTQAVTYISQRFASLAALFVLSSALAYAAFSSEERPFRRAAFYCLSLVLAALALFTKENALMLPVAIILFEISFVRAGALKSAARVSPFLAMSCALALAVAARLRSDLGGGGGLVPLDGTYAITSIRVAVTYVRMMFFPAGLSMEYDYPSFSSLMSFEIIASLLFLLLTAASAVYCLYISRKKDPAYSAVFFGIFWFFGFLSIENGLIRLDDVIFEHRLYLPSAGLIFAAAVFAFRFAGFVKTPDNARAARLALFLIPAVLALAAFERNKVWQSEIDLWKDARDKSPAKLRPNLNLGYAYYKAGNYKEASDYIEKAVEIAPDSPEALLHLGLAYYETGNLSGAEELMLKAAKRAPGKPRPLAALGAIYGRTGKTEKAFAFLNAAIAVAPEDPTAYNALGSVYIMQAMPEKAVETIARGIEANPTYNGYYLLGAAYAKMGMTNDAVKAYEDSIRINSSSPKAYAEIGYIFLASGSNEEAIINLERAYALDPEDLTVTLSLFLAYSNKGDWNKANRYGEKVFGNTVKPGAQDFPPLGTNN